MIDTIKIGHIIGPPLWNLSINQLPPRKPGGCSGLADTTGEAPVVAAAGLCPAGAGLNVTGTDAPGAAGCPAGTFVAGDCAAAAGFVGACAAGLVPGAPAGAVAGACPGGGDCANEISANASKERDVLSNVFIVEAGVLR